MIHEQSGIEIDFACGGISDSPWSMSLNPKEKVSRSRKLLKELLSAALIPILKTDVYTKFLLMSFRPMSLSNNKTGLAAALWMSFRPFTSVKRGLQR